MICVIKENVIFQSSGTPNRNDDIYFTASFLVLPAQYMNARGIFHCILKTNGMFEQRHEVNSIRCVHLISWLNSLVPRRLALFAIIKELIQISQQIDFVTLQKGKELTVNKHTVNSFARPAWNTTGSWDGTWSLETCLPVRSSSTSS